MSMQGITTTAMLQQDYNIRLFPEITVGTAESKESLAERRGAELNAKVKRVRESNWLSKFVY